MAEAFQQRLVEALRREAQFPPHRVVLERGSQFGPAKLGEGVERGALGNCFANAYRLASADRALRYFEGYALHAGMPEWLARHAWCVDSGGKVVDPTWGANRPLPLAYRGVFIPLEVAEPYAFEGSNGALEEGGEEVLAKLGFG